MQPASQRADDCETHAAIRGAAPPALKISGGALAGEETIYTRTAELGSRFSPLHCCSASVTEPWFLGSSRIPSPQHRYARSGESKDTDRRVGAGNRAQGAKDRGGLNSANLVCSMCFMRIINPETRARLIVIDTGLCAQYGSVLSVHPRFSTTRIGSTSTRVLEAVTRFWDACPGPWTR